MTDTAAALDTSAERVDNEPFPPAPGRSRRVTDVILCVLLVVLSLGFSVRHVSGHNQTSPIDEYVYIDYYAKVLHQGVVRQGEKTGDYAREYYSCHPNRVFGAWQPQLCAPHRHRPDAAYPFLGSTWAGLYTPLYFLSVRIPAQPLIWAGVDFVQAGRYATGLWLALGVVLLFLALRRIGVHQTIAFAAGLIVSGSLVAYWADTYLSTDAPALAAGAGMLYTTFAYLQRPSRRSAVAVMVVAVLAAALKIQNLEAVAVAGMFLMFLAGSQVRATAGRTGAKVALFLRDSRTRLAITAMVLGVFVEVVWLVIRAMLSVGRDVDQGVSGPFQFPAHLFLDMTAFLPGVAMSGLASPEVGPWGDISVHAMTLVIVGGVVGLAFARGARTWERALAVSVLFASIVAGPALSLATMTLNHVYVPLVSRYGAPIFPGMVACAALLLPSESRVARGTALVMGVFLYGIGLAFRQ